MTARRTTIYASGPLLSVLEGTGSGSFSRALKRITTQHARLIELSRPALTVSQWTRLFTTLEQQNCVTEQWRMIPALYATAMPGDQELNLALTMMKEAQQIATLETYLEWRKLDEDGRAQLIESIAL